ncbi:phosphatidylglycerophosphatase A [Pelagibacteraceae bacterium]|jgi:phosphatidylglycerophosphatase A|nr:phosphatidylglycerophosphatase A [Pelagibacteraceae bacterium]
MINKFLLSILTMFGIGYSKYASGTVASFVTCVIFYSLYSVGYLESRGIYLICIIIIIFFLSILLIDKFSDVFDKKDAKEIVIDEFVGQNIPLFFLLFIPLNTATYNKDFMILIVLSFIFFRFFDILKPYPINLIDKKMKNGLGVMLDDVIAGIFSALLIYMVTLIWP